MAKIHSTERVIEYDINFKIQVVKLTYTLNVEAAEIAEALGLHPMMVYRWRQEYREGKFKPSPTRYISMTKNASTPPEDKAARKEIKRLKKELESLKKENDFLKKWDRYLKEQSKKDSNS